MIIFRTKKPEILKYIYPKMVVDDGANKDIIAEDIFAMMNNNPDNTCVIVGFDGDYLKIFLIAFYEEGKNFVWIDQVWIDTDVNKKYSNELVDAIKKWAKDFHNIDELRFQTERNPEAFKRSWGFNIHSYVLSNKEYKNE